MPVNKRTLSANAKQPAAKKNATGKRKPAKAEGDLEEGEEGSANMTSDGDVEEKGAKSDEQDDEDDTETDEDKTRSPAAYICVPRPYWTREDPYDNQELQERHAKDIKAEPKMWKKPAEENPDWKYIQMWETVNQLNILLRRASFCEPTNFNIVHIYEDFFGYGLMDIIDHCLVDIERELKSHDLKAMWAIVSALGWFLNQNESLSMWMNCDDGEKVIALRHVIGTSILAALNALDMAGKLEKDSAEFRDIGFVMAAFFRHAVFMEDRDTFDCREEHLIAYAKRLQIDLKDQGIDDLDDALKKLDKTKPLEGQAEATRWGWQKIFNKYVKEHGVVRSKKFKSQYSIVQMSRAERKKYSSDGKDPLADFTDAMLKNEEVEIVQS